MNFFVFVLMLRCHRASIWVIQYRGLWEGRVQYQYAVARVVFSHDHTCLRLSSVTHRTPSPMYLYGTP